MAAWNKLRNSFFLAIAAGIFIGIGGTVLLSCDNRYFGAVFFTIALLCICMMGLYLFTGKIGFFIEIHTVENAICLLSGLLGNAVGTWLTAAAVRIARPGLLERVSDMVASKLTQSWYQTILTGILCGILMYSAVVIYRDRASVWGILFCVPVFILAGFEHSVADMYYFFLSGTYSLSGLVFILLVVLGNALGGMLIPLLRRIAGISST